MKIMAYHDVTHLESSIHLVVNVFQPATLNPRNIGTAKRPFYQNLVRSMLGTLRISSSLNVSNSQCDLQKRSKHLLPVHIVARNFRFFWNSTIPKNMFYHFCLFGPTVKSFICIEFERDYQLGVYLNNYIILLMEEILHHLGCIKPCKQWDKLPTLTG